MQTDSTARVDEFPLGDDSLQIMVAGQGRPLLVLHDEMGYPGWMAWQSALAATHELHIPRAPGFGLAPRIAWVNSVRDLACVYAHWLRSSGLAPIDAVGFSFGGWLLAEMLANDPSLVSRAVYVAPLGIKPSEGVILDAFELTHRAQLEATVAHVAATPEFDELYGGQPSPAQIEAFDDARAESARLAWQPYMHNPSLPHLLAGVGDRVASLVVWGDADCVVPRSAVRQFAASLGDCALHCLAGCGHRPEIERRDEFVQIVGNFLSRS